MSAYEDLIHGRATPKDAIELAILLSDADESDRRRAYDDNAQLRAAIASAADILRGFAMRGQEGDLQAAAEWLEKYGGLK